MDDDTSVLGPDGDDAATAADDPGFETIRESDRYVLGAADDFYGIWDKHDLDEPLDRFAAEEDGYDRAETLFLELTRIDRIDRQPWRRWMEILIPLAVGLWVLSGAIIALQYSGLFVLGQSGRFNALIEVISFRVWFGSLVVALGAMLLQQHPRRIPGTFPERTGRRWLAVFVSGLAIWTIGGLWRIFDTSDELGGGLGGASLAPSVIEFLGFRVAILGVGMLAYLALRAFMGTDSRPVERPADH